MRVCTPQFAKTHCLAKNGRKPPNQTRNPPRQTLKTKIKILFKLLGTKPQTEQDQRSIAGPNSNTIQSVRVNK